MNEPKKIASHPNGPTLMDNGRVVCSADEVINLGYNNIIRWAREKLVELHREDLIDNLPEEEPEDEGEEMGEDEELFPDDVETAEDTPVEPPSAENAPKKVRGRPFTKENAKAMQMSAAAAKKARKQARMKMLDALCNRLDMGDELVKAMQSHDADYLKMIVDATRLVGLQHDQSSEALAQKMEFKGDLNNNHSVKLVIEDMTKPTDGK